VGERRWLLAFLIAGGVVLPVEIHARHGVRPGAGIVAWLIYAAIVRLVICVVDMAPEGKTRQPSPTSRSQTWPVRYGVLALVAVMVLAFGLALLKSLVGWTWPEATKGSLAIDALFLVTLVPLYRTGRLGWADLGIRILPRKLAVGLFLLGLAAIVVFNVIWRTIVSLPRVEDGLAGLPHRGTLTILLTGVALCLAAPIVEEVFFRGLLYRTLRNRLAIVPAALLVGILFGLGHSQYPLLERPQQAVFGFIACLVYERGGSLLPCIAMHMLVDSYAFTFALTGLAWIVPSVFLLVGLVVLYGAPMAARLARPRGRARPRTA
jgi:membrane protease YdiL (CAAX protease family)